MQTPESHGRLIAALPVVERYQDAFAAQNKMLSRTTLTGKISSLEHASTLFEFMEETHRRFGSLQERLIGCLVDENIKSAALEAASRAQATIDILIRNLFERTADVGFLATDEDLIGFLRDPGSGDRQAICRRLEEYVHKYTVYRNIKLLTPAGRELISLTPRAASFCATQLPQNDEYQEMFRLEGQSAELFYLCRMKEGDHSAGVLVLDFDFEAEMAQIYEALTKNLSGILALTDDKNRVISSSDTARLPVGAILAASDTYRIVTLAKRAYLAIGVKTKGYEGFYGQSWRGVALISLDREVAGAAPITKGDRTLCLLPQSLREIVSQAEEITEDLGDVVINGELIASKTRTYSLNPVLENIRAIGEQTQQIFVDSLGNLEQTVISSLVGEVALLSRLAVDILDRNLYERANDCRWWALSTHFRKALASGTTSEADRVRMGEILAYINSLYTVYTLLYIYNREGKICAVSTPKATQLIGQDVRDMATQKTLSNAETQRYFVSDFTPSPLYDNRPTYVYHATVLSLENEPVGGIGIVFDAKPQFAAILTDMLPQDHGGPTAGAFNLFADEQYRVIASTHPALTPGSLLPEELRVMIGAPAGVYRYDGRDYIAAWAISGGYREYKRTDGYRSPITALTLLPAKRA